MRLDGGDAGGWNGYARSTSSDGGVTWSKPVLLGSGIGCARPRLLSLGNGSLLLSGGRPVYNSRDTKVWFNALGDGIFWTEYSISYWHNLLEKNETRHFSPTINSSTSWPRESTSYTSLVRTGPSSAFVVYQLARGDGYFNGAFSMPIKLVNANQAHTIV